MCCRSRNGLILIESCRGADELERYFNDRKMTSLLNRVIILSEKDLCDVEIDFHVNQIKPCLLDLVLTSVNSSIAS